MRKSLASKGSSMYMKVPRFPLQTGLLPRIPRPWFRDKSWEEEGLVDTLKSTFYCLEKVKNRRACVAKFTFLPPSRPVLPETGVFLKTQRSSPYSTPQLLDVKLQLCRGASAKGHRWVQLSSQCLHSKARSVYLQTSSPSSARKVNLTLPPKPSSRS